MSKSPWLKYKVTDNGYGIHKGWEDEHYFLCGQELRRWVREHTGARLVKKQDVRIHIKLNPDGAWSREELPRLTMNSAAWLYSQVHSDRFDIWVETKDAN